MKSGATFCFCWVRHFAYHYAASVANLAKPTAKNQARGGSVTLLGHAPVEQGNPQLPAAGSAKPHLRALFWCLAIALGLLQLWAHRNDVNPDGISYIEMAEAAGRSGWHALVNAYWSPLYPALLSIAFWIFHPAIDWEFTVLHVVNFALYLAELLCFEIFVKELLAARRIENVGLRELQSASEKEQHTAPDKSTEGSAQTLPLPEEILWIWGYLLFLWTSQFWLSLAVTNPDIIVAGLVFVATALLLRIYRGEGNWLLFAGLGALLGLGYFAKAAMFPIFFFFLTSAFLLYGVTRKSFAKALARSALALAVFLAIAAPLIVALSKEKHRITFGDSGKIAYAEYVDHATFIAHWRGEPAGTGTAVHPTRKISNDPPIYEFAKPVAGSYPPWYDPSYWYEGIRPHFSLKGQLWVLFRSANLYLKMFSRGGALYVVFLALILEVWKRGKWDWGGRPMALVMLPSLATLAMYALVLVEQRYVSPFVLMLFFWIFSSARIFMKEGGTLKKQSVLAVILALAAATAWPVTRDLRDAIANRPYEPWEVAVGLHELGVPPGTQVGAIGLGVGNYWAHLAGVRIIAEIPEREQASFLAGDAPKKREALQKFEEVGVKAVVTKNAAVANSIEGWREVGQTQYYVWRPPQH